MNIKTSRLTKNERIPFTYEKKNIIIYITHLVDGENHYGCTFDFETIRVRFIVCYESSVRVNTTAGVCISRRRMRHGF